MTDDPGRAVDVATVRDRVREHDDVDYAENVLTAIEDRAEDGRIAFETMTDWHRTCRESHRSTAADLRAAEARFEALRESIDPIDRDTNQVRSRVDEYADQFEAMRSALASTEERLDATPEPVASAVAVYEAAANLRRCGGVVHEVAHSLHHVEEGLEEFETWLDDAATRIDALDEEIDGFERYLDNTEALLDGLEADGDAGIEPFDAWLAAHHLQRLMALVFAELRADLAELDAWLERRDGSYAADVAALRERLDTLEERHETCSARLDAATATIEEFEAKRAEVAESLERFEAALDDREPPVDWGEVDDLVQSQFDDLGIQVR
jgi:chromosome segregation ATPase